MSDPALGLLMLTLIVVVIMMGFPTAFTLMGLGIFFGYIAFHDPTHSWADNRVFDLMVERTYGAMTNDVLISIPLFVLMGYVMERGALVDKMFYSIQLAFRKVPASLAVATLIVCTFWGIASGLVGAVVVLMGVIAFNPMLNAAAMFPGFFLSFLYLIYIIAWATIDPKIAPPLPEDQTKVPVPAWLSRFEDTYRSQTILISLIKGLRSPSRAREIDTEGRPVSYWMLLSSFGYALVPFMIVAGTMATVWWYVVIHQQPAIELAVTGVQQLGTPELVTNEATPAELGPGLAFYLWFWSIAAVCALLQVRYYWRFNAERLSIVKLLTSSTMPLGILTVVVLAVILFGICTATESAAVGAFGAFLLAVQARTLDWERTKQAVFLTAKTTAMVCWLFVGSALFSGVFAILGGQALLEQWVLSLNMTPVQFMILSQAIIFVLGWPLEWTEIIIIFVPIFLPMLKHFNIDPILWGTLVFVNLQAAFLSPPVAMSAFYLKGVSPPHVTLNQIFAGMMPYMLIVILYMMNY